MRGSTRPSPPCRSGCGRASRTVSSLSAYGHRSVQGSLPGYVPGRGHGARHRWHPHRHGRLRHRRAGPLRGGRRRQPRGSDRGNIRGGRTQFLLGDCQRLVVRPGRIAIRQAPRAAAGIPLDLQTAGRSGLAAGRHGETRLDGTGRHRCRPRPKSCRWRRTISAMAIAWRKAGRPSTQCGAMSVIIWRARASIATGPAKRPPSRRPAAGP